MSRFKEALASDKFLITAAVPSPKGTNLDPFHKGLEALSGLVDAVNLSEARSARIHMGSPAACVIAGNAGLEPIYTLSCRDRNRLAACSELLGVHALGIRNVLCVTGDYFNYGDTPDAKPVYDLDSVQAIEMVRELEAGRDAGGNDLDGAAAFCVGCVANPQADPLKPHLLKLEKKLSAGAEFIQTLDIYDMDAASPFFEKMKGRNIKVLAGVRLVTAREVGLWEKGKLPGNDIPEGIRAEIKGLDDEAEMLQKAGSRMAEMIRQIKNAGLCGGVHLTLDGHEERLRGILEEAGVR
ncbi:MAG: methylenetetrahydrofolate reductase [Deltaproteobacteria bacterium]|nr:methylenetetrahydrofolate reductase [Deltaproteobacteria bacterium]